MSPRHPLTVGWSPDRKLWEALDRAGEGLSWRKVDFYRDKAHLVSREGRGVYLICAAPPVRAIDRINPYTVLYAGQVKGRHRTLRDRFLEHVRNPSPQLKLFVDCYFPAVHFCFATVDDPSRIDELEVLLLELFNPPCNRISAPGTQIILARIGVGQFIGRIGKQ